MLQSQPSLRRNLTLSSNWWLWGQNDSKVGCEQSCKTKNKTSYFMTQFLHIEFLAPSLLAILIGLNLRMWTVALLLRMVDPRVLCQFHQARWDWTFKRYIIVIAIVSCGFYGYPFSKKYYIYTNISASVRFARASHLSLMGLKVQLGFEVDAFLLQECQGAHIRKLSGRGA